LGDASSRLEGPELNQYFIKNNLSVRNGRGNESNISDYDIVGMPVTANQPEGLYYYKLNAGQFNRKKKMLQIK